MIQHPAIQAGGPFAAGPAAEAAAPIVNAVQVAIIQRIRHLPGFSAIMLTGRARLA
jgi:hypothetical protein